MQDDLRNLAIAQAGYAADNAGAYSANLTSLNFTASTGVTVTVNYAGPNGWAATAVHTALPATENCGKYIQNGATAPTPIAPATASGEPKCV
jgi:hypothetical protein